MTANRYTSLYRIASLLQKSAFARARFRHEKPDLMVFTDPVRADPPEQIIPRLPKGTMLVYRHFGADDRVQKAKTLSALCNQYNVMFAIGADPDLARKTGAKRLHLPERMLGQLALIRARHSFTKVSVAAHSIGAARRALALGADCVVFSPVFPSGSPSATKPMGISRFALAVQKINGPVVALGGIQQQNAKKLAALCEGVAIVSAANRP